MYKKNLIILIFFSLLANGYSQPILFDSGWRFHRGELTGAEAPDFDDSMWRKIDLPHDWSIEDLPGTQSPFDPDAISKMAGGYTTGGTAWYRKTFNVPEEQEGKRINIQFDGVYMDADVWLNGEHIGNHPYGYTSFWYDVTDIIKFGEKNIISIEVKNEGQNSRWYSGSGIYRHVWLRVLDPVYVEPWGIFITTPAVSPSLARVNVKTAIRNTTGEVAKVNLVTRILDPKGLEVSRGESQLELVSKNGTELDQDISVSFPDLWSQEFPVLYTAVTDLFNNDNPISHSETRFGIRSISFDAANGFLLNGKSVELKGGCMHHDNGILGAAAIDRAEERKVELLKAYGFNAVRCSHNPPSEKFLEACDRLGILVIDEAFDMWQEAKNPDDYHLYFEEWWERDLSSMILRDRNHPSIIMWSLGNEIEERADSSGIEIMKKFRALINRYDTTRPLTMAVNEFWDHPGRQWDQTAPAFEQVDVGGYNYQWWQYEPDHQKFPGRIMMGTESVPVHAYQNWQLVEDHPYVVGDFVWTSMDYLGEAGIGHITCEEAEGNQLMPWPWFNANCGDIDLTGNKKPQSYFRDIVWRRSDIEMAVHAPLPEGCKEAVSYWGWPDERQSWTWPGYEGKVFKVNVYSRHERVRLELNGKIIGEKQIADTCLLTAAFEVPYEPGELKAIALEDRKPVEEVTLITAGEPALIRLRADRNSISASRNDLSYVTVEVTDKKGNIVPDAALSIVFEVKGAGEIAAAGNASPSEMTSFQQPRCNTFRGRCLLILRPDGQAGKIILRAKAHGLKPAKTEVTTIQSGSLSPQKKVKTLRILVIGDSNTEIGNITMPMKSLLDSTYGDFGTGYCTLNTNSMGRVPDGLSVNCDSNWIRFDMRNDWIPEPGPYYSPDGLSISSQIPGSAVTVRFSGNGINLYYLKNPGGGSFSVSIDGRDMGIITGRASVPAAEKVSFNRLAPGQHAMVISVVSGKSTLLGVDARKKKTKDNRRFIIHKWGNGWASTEEYANIDENVFITSLQELNPDKIVVLIGTNDHNLDRRDAAGVKTNLKTILSRIKKALPDAGVFVVSTFTTDGNEAKELLPEYVNNSFPEAAAETGSSYWDMNTWFGPYNPEKIQDGVHVNEEYGKIITRQLLHQLKY